MPSLTNNEHCKRQEKSGQVLHSFCKHTHANILSPLHLLIPFCLEAAVKKWVTVSLFKNNLRLLDL